MDELNWDTDKGTATLPWRAARPGKPPRRAVAADDRITADSAYRAVSQGTAIVWTGDYVNARQLLQAIARRIEGRKSAPNPGADPAARFHANRQAEAQRAAMLSLLLVPVENGRIALPRGPDAAEALADALGETPPRYLLPLRDAAAALSAAEWKKNGVPVAALDGQKIHPRYGVFPPTRQDYIDLMAATPLGEVPLAFDIGTGSGVLTALLLKMGVARVTATDTSPVAIACAAANFERLGIADRVTLLEQPLFPAGRAPLVVCNPPWLPGKAATPLEASVYDEGSRMLDGFLNGARDHLEPGGEAWLIISDIAERLGLRPAGELLRKIEAAGLTIREKRDAPPTHKKARDEADPLHFARANEVVSLYRLSA
ncbi:MAG: class I SAM-dependent methyltransferase [Hyphomicrobiales bacterium]|nr:MAG: class I SAM-dependent methyltransferase [Hyphomicrobiales bacterium]